MDNSQLRLLKDRCLEDLRGRLAEYGPRLAELDERLYAYVSDAIRSDMDTANIYELCGIRKVIRLLHTYRLNADTFRAWLRAIEGSWQKTDSGWQHIGGGLRFSTPRGAQHVRLMPFQVWIIFGMYAIDKTESMGALSELGRPLEPTEYVVEGEVFDVRRLCREAHIFITRKAGKTELGAAVDVVETCVLGPMNAQCHIVGNSSDQAKKIAYKAVKNFLYQLDPKAATTRGQGKYLRVTESDGAEWKPGFQRTASIYPLPAGGKPKDGTYDSLVHIDEHGQAEYVNGRSDMEMTAQVCIGSMGPRREKMVMHTTTAGHCHEGPYQIAIHTVENQLTDEMSIPFDLQPHTTANDHYFALLLRLDPWEITDDLDALNHENLFRKVNRSIGITVQPSYYRERLQDARNNHDTMVEVLTKDFNIWRSENLTEWIQPDDIRRLQVDMRIDDCKEEYGWRVFVGMDFSMGDDLHAVSYLAFRQTDTGTEFFADMDAWISEDTLQTSPHTNLYHKWIDGGWLHVSPGKTLEPTLPVERIINLYNGGVTFLGFGYDTYKAKAPINELSAWVADLVGAKAVKDYIVPVSQSYASYNPVVEELDYMIKAEPALIRFSMNPMWPWEFGNVVLDIDTRYENKKPLKRNPAAKVDNIQCLLSALIMLDRADGREQAD